MYEVNRSVLVIKPKQTIVDWLLSLPLFHVSGQGILWRWLLAGAAGLPLAGCGGTKTVTTTDAHVDYNYTSIETRTVTVNGEETVIVPPVTPPETPVEDETPDEVVTPETPELPPVQDATPDDAAPETPETPKTEA